MTTTLQNLAIQMSNTLTEINTSTSDTDLQAVGIKGDTANIYSGLTAIGNTLTSIETTVAGGLFAIFEAQKLTNALLEGNVQQNQTIICWLKTEADLLCRILRRIDTQIEIDTATRDAVIKLAKVVELAHPRETLEVEQIDRLHAEMLKCCPPKEKPQEPCYDGCPEPRLPSYEPRGQDWTPPQGTTLSSKGGE